MARFSGDAEAIRISTVARTFSQMRGTAKNRVGWTSRRLSWTVSIDSAKWTWVPAAAFSHSVAIRSATWHSGRYDRVTSSGPGFSKKPPSSTRTLMAKSMLATVSMAPLGGPVVPEV